METLKLFCKKLFRAMGITLHIAIMLFCILMSIRSAFSGGNESTSLIERMLSCAGWITTIPIYIAMLVLLWSEKKRNQIFVYAFAILLGLIGFCIGYYGFDVTGSWDIACGFGLGISYGILFCFILITMCCEYLSYKNNRKKLKQWIKKAFIVTGGIIGALIVISLLIFICCNC